MKLTGYLIHVSVISMGKDFTGVCLHDNRRGIDLAVIDRQGRKTLVHIPRASVTLSVRLAPYRFYLKVALAVSLLPRFLAMKVGKGIKAGWARTRSLLSKLKRKGNEDGTETKGE